MRILHIIPYFYPAWAYGGTCRAAWEVARATARRGHEVMALTTDSLDSARRIRPLQEVVEGVSIRRFANLSNRLAWSRLFMPVGFASALKEALPRADVVHLHEYRTLQDAIALPMLRRYRKPYILTAQGGVPMLIGRFALKRVYDSLVGEKLLRGATKLHALNEMEAEQYLAAGGSPPQIFLSPNGINAADYGSLPDVGDFRARHTIPRDAPLVLFLARVNKIKGVDFLASAFAHLRQTLPSAMLMIVGPDDGFLPEVQQHIQKLGIAGAVRYVGYLDGMEKLRAYQAADLYVLPSSYEILGITLLESLACGTPVITTDRCGLAAELTRERLGDVVPYADVPQLSRAMSRALSAGKQSAKPAARDYVLKRFDWESLAEGWERVYAECADRGGKR